MRRWSSSNFVARIEEESVHVSTSQWSMFLLSRDFFFFFGLSLSCEIENNGTGSRTGQVYPNYYFLKLISIFPNK